MGLLGELGRQGGTLLPVSSRVFTVCGLWGGQCGTIVTRAALWLAARRMV
jgi:hypothetical protein